MRDRVDATPIVLDPGTRAQRLLIRDGYDRDVTRAVDRRRRVHDKARLLGRRAIEQTINVVRRFELLPVYRQDVVTQPDIDAGRRKRSAKIRVPRFVVVDLRDLVSTVLDREVGAE